MMAPSADAESSLFCAAACDSFVLGWRQPLFDDDPSQQRVGPQNGKLVLHIRITVVDAAIVDNGIQAWSPLALLEQYLG